MKESVTCSEIKHTRWENKSLNNRRLKRKVRDTRWKIRIGNNSRLSVTSCHGRWIHKFTNKADN